MDIFVVRFIKASLTCLLLGTILGVLFLYNSNYQNLVFVHSHFNLLGFVSMMIFGVGYHVLPRFRGKELYSKPMANIQFWTANIGLIGMATFYTISVYFGGRLTDYLLVLFGITMAVSILLFVINLLATFREEKPEK